MRGLRELLLVAAAGAALLLVQDTGADTVVSPIPVGIGPQQEQLSPDGSKLIVSNELANTVSVISTATDAVLATIPTGTDPGPIRFLPDGSKAYVADFLDKTVSVINMSTSPPSAGPLLTVGTNPITLTATVDGTKVYAVNEGSNTISIICTGKTPLPAGCSGADTVLSGNIKTGSGPWGATLANGVVPSGVAYDPANGLAYVANSNSNNVSVIDGTNTVVAVVPVGIDPRGVAVYNNGATNKVFVVDNGKKGVAGSRTVSVINGATNTVSATIPFPDTSTPTGIGVNSGTKEVYVANNGTNDVSVIDADTEMVAVASIPVGVDPSSVAVDPNTNLVYISNNKNGGGGNSVSVIDGNQFLPSPPAAPNTPNPNYHTEIARISVGVNPRGVAVNPTTKRVYVANGGPTDTGNTVSVIDVDPASVSYQTVIGTITVGTGPSGVAVNPTTNHVYVANNSGTANTVSVIDGGTNAVSTLTMGAGQPRGASRVAVNTGANRVYVSNKISNDVTVINGALGMTPASVAADVAVGSEPHTITKTPTGARAFVANQQSNNVTVVDIATNAVVKNIPVGPSPGSIIFKPDGSQAYVASRGCSDISVCTATIAPTVAVIDTVTNTVLTTIPVGVAGAAPHAMRITPDGNKLYVINKHTNEVKVISTATNSVTTTIPITTGACSDPLNPPGDPSLACPVRIGLTYDGSRAYVENEAPTAASGTLSIICTGLVPTNCLGATDTVMATLTVGSKPVDLEISCQANKAYTSNSGSNNVSVVNLTGIGTCPAGPDSDGDGVPDAIDNCPNWPNPTQALPPWPVPPSDPDCDGFKTTAENYMGTNPIVACGTNDWPPDFSSDTWVGSGDLVLLAKVFGSIQGPPPVGNYIARRDLNQDHSIGSGDLVILAKFFGKQCT